MTQEANVAPAGADSMDRVREKVGLSFSRVRQEYVVQDQRGGSSGTVAAGFDVKANKEI